MNSHLNFATLLKNRELCALYILNKNQPQNLQLFQTEVINSFWFVHAVPVSTVKFFHDQWKQNNLAADSLLKMLDAHHEEGPLKKILVDPKSNLIYAYIPSLRKYLE
jgi:hypothetical protein